MDALSALGIAGTVTQFVSFTGELISKASELHESATNCTAEVQNIHSVYGTLFELSRGLRNAERDLSELGSNLQAGKLLVLVTECQRDCDKLLDITRALRAGGENKTWLYSFRKAIESTWKLSEIRLLDERLQRTQLTLVLLVCSISSEFQRVQQDRIARLQKDGGLNRLNQDRQFADLRQILQSIHSQVSRLEDVGSSYSSQRIAYPSHVTELEKQMQDLCVNANDIQKQQAILDTLSFDSRSMRHQAIPEAHPGTFQWALATEGPDEDAGEDEEKLMHWLKQGKGIFWVTGRPGSGKSTFMKHMADSPGTRAALRQWAGSSELVVSSHYFWIFGTQMQKSKEGLFRTLLYEIFRQHPALLKIVCPHRWGSDFSSKTWSLAELRHVLDIVTSAELGVKICFFIDGLDEYGGDHIEVSDELSRLSNLENVKCCISSRPWNVFNDAFGCDGSQHLCLHNLTKRDIRHYVRDRLTPHPRWQRLVDHAVYNSQLIDYIADKSHGVFLWVALVTDRIRSGLTNDDDLSDLSSRLAKFPSDLESFFDHILQTVEPFYHEKMAGTLRLARAAEKPLSILFYEFHDTEYRDEEYFLRVKCPRSDRERDIVRDRVQRRLNAYCKGLLEVHDDRVEFLHRTVADYLSIPDVAERLLTQSPEWFNPELSLAKVHLTCMKMGTLAVPDRRYPGYYDSGQLDEHLRAVLSLASIYDSNASAVRDKFCRILHDTESSLTIPPVWTPAPCIPRGSTSLYFRERLLQSRLPKYVEKMLLENGEYFKGFDWPPLAIILQEGCPSQHVETMQLLFEHGQKPNKKFDVPVSDSITRKKTPWTSLMALVVRQTRDGLASRVLPYFGPCLRAGVFDLFLKYGADANASVYRREGQPHTTAWIDFLFACFEIGRQDEERYLRVLDQLLQADASLDEAIPVGPESATYTEAPSETILKRFFQLERVLESSSEFDFSRDFMVRVSEYLVRKACWARWPLDAVWLEVEQALGDATTKHLRAVYHAERELWKKDRLYAQLIKGAIRNKLFRAGKRKLDDKIRNLVS